MNRQSEVRSRPLQSQTAVCLHEKDEIESFVRRNPFLHLYELGDLDDPYWQHSIWYALKDGDRIRELVLLYTDLPIPILLANSDQASNDMRDLLHAVAPLLPKRFHAYVSVEAVVGLEDVYDLHSHGTHYTMGLMQTSHISTFDAAAAAALTADDLDDLNELYSVSYPGNWFLPRMVDTGFYYGIWHEQDLVSVAGVHVYSPRYKVAVLGNIVTHPDLRGRGMGMAVCAKLCQELVQAGVAHIGLNVKTENTSAIRCYEKLGFKRVAEYGEYVVVPPTF